MGGKLPELLVGLFFVALWRESANQVLPSFGATQPVLESGSPFDEFDLENVTEALKVSAREESNGNSLACTMTMYSLGFADMSTLCNATGVVTSSGTTIIMEILPGESSWNWRPIKWSLWLILQMMTALTGILGNFAVIVVLFQRRNQSRSTDTLIGALAAADLMTSVFMVPLPTPGRVPSTILGEVYCKVVFPSILMWVAAKASIFTLTVIPIERYIAIVYPFHFKRLVSHRRITTCIVFIWVAAFAINIFLFFITGVDPTTSRCYLMFPSRTMQITVGLVQFIILLLIPAFCTLVMQALTARSLHIQSLSYLGADNRLDWSNPSARHLLAKKRILQMLFIVVVLFIVCWGPSQIAILAFGFGILPPTYLYSPLNRALVLLSFCNSCANPIVYTARYPEFRAALVGIFTFAKRTNTPLFGEKESKTSPSKRISMVA